MAAKQRQDQATQAQDVELDPGRIFERAAERARSLGLPYAGAVTPLEAGKLLASGAATLIDVRTFGEWEFVGRVPDSKLIEWRRAGEQQPNPAFLQHLRGAVEPNEAVLFLCRSGVRSHHAAEAATRVGYERAYNILEGFEGDLDDHRHRGRTGGWRFHGLPWIQS
jgi:rhodanese-related sulfurtransferase